MQQKENSKLSGIGEQPLISVITVVYNAADTLTDTIESVIKQTYSNIQYIIVDGGSKDGTIEIIKHYKSYIHKWVSESDKGIYDAMNKAMKLADGHWAIFLGADDVFYDKNVVEHMVTNFKSPYEIYYGNAVFKTSEKLYDVTLSKNFLCLRNLSHQTIFYPRAVYKNNSYDLKYRLFSDHIYNINLFIENKYHFNHLPVTTVLYNDAGSSSQGNDPDYFNDLPNIIGKKFGICYGLYVHMRFAIFKLKKHLFNNQVSSF